MIILKMDETNTTFAKTCKMHFEIEGEITEPVDADKITRGFAFLNQPFIGRFYMLFDGKDILKDSPRQRNLYPFEFIEWMIDNFEAYISEPRPKKSDEVQEKKHILAYHLGDYCPQIELYQQNDLEYVEYVNGTFKISTEVIGREINRISLDAVSMLKNNPTFENHKKLEELEAKVRANYKFLRK